MPIETCATCRYWVRYTHNDKTKGECRKSPPMYVKRAKVAGRHPETKENCFCDEWKVKN